MKRFQTNTTKVLGYKKKKKEKKKSAGSAVSDQTKAGVMTTVKGRNQPAGIAETLSRTFSLQS
jgi:hypothetical protein